MLLLLSRKIKIVRSSSILLYSTSYRRIMSTDTKARTALEELNDGGEFKRKESAFRDVISAEHPVYKPEVGRYHLYISLACPWANGCYCLLKMKGLEDIVGVSIVHYTWQKTRQNDEGDSHTGWVFSDPNDPPVTAMSGAKNLPCDGCIPDTNYGVSSIRELYEMSNDGSGKYSVPVLWDKKTKTIVNNESLEILPMLNSSFDQFLPEESPARKLNLFPAELASIMSDTNDWIYSDINNGVYRAGFATSQRAYDTAVTTLFESLNRVEDILSKSRYICGPRMTFVDIRLFMTLIRFDEVYVVYFKCNMRELSTYPNITNFMRELYQNETIQSVINMMHIKGHYFTSHLRLNTYGIIPKGPDVIANMMIPHDRDKLE